MMDTGPDHTAEPTAIAGYDPDGHRDDQGPASWERPAAVAAETGGYASFKCGTVAARTRFIVMYRVEGGEVGVAELESCCRNWEHEPPDLVALIDEAEVLQIDIADGHEQEITTNETITTRGNPAPGHYIDPANPWAWTLIDGLPETVVPIEEVEIEVRPTRQAAEQAQVREYATDPDRFDRLHTMDRARREAEAAARQAERPTSA